jgi:hypothetical protein
MLPIQMGIAAGISLIVGLLTLLAHVAMIAWTYPTRHGGARTRRFFGRSSCSLPRFWASYCTLFSAETGECGCSPNVERTDLAEARCKLVA